jgi:sRNA-binding protein
MPERDRQVETAKAAELPDAARRAKMRLREKRLRTNLKVKVPAILEELRAKYPRSFPADPTHLRPWAIGLLGELARVSGHSKNLLREVLKQLAATREYQAALAAGGPRFDLAGDPRGEVAAEHRAKAAAKLSELAGEPGGTAAVVSDPLPARR